ncbi:hypothetical protein RBSWK_00346 [Rhodopirellula baltica SWK14]|uniref:Uncharacterized protein n=1 Tax=Rhodopirellula baltica SWK14 TaxID=993516 RepID=L7CRC8_RHOBT|nr:hypothetical protein RBSWK_00346 [Rhodopirellula baltica SWK14]
MNDVFSIAIADIQNRQADISKCRWIHVYPSIALRQFTPPEMQAFATNSTD